jgi:DNA-directed RNA polymerase specialized sigma24 family protein
MQDITDEALMTMFQRGNPAAFDVLFERYRGPVFNFLFRMVHRDRGTAEDLLQEVFLLRALEGLAHEEIGEVLGLNTATVRTLYHRARLMLQKRTGDLVRHPETRGNTP